MTAVIEVHEPTDRSALCERVLRDLPEWFGIEEATAAYIRDVADLPTLAAGRAFYEACGFAPLEELHGLWEHNPYLLMVKHL